MEKMGKRFLGKVAIVTASTQGIGFSIAERLGLEGAAIVISSRRQKNVDEAVEKLKAKGIEVLGVVCHVSNAEQRKNLVDKTVQKYGEIDVIVSNAAANPSVNAILDTQESVLDKLWEINVKASILLLKVSSFMNNVFTPKKTQKRKNKQKKGPFREHDAISEA